MFNSKFSNLAIRTNFILQLVNLEQAQKKVSKSFFIEIDRIGTESLSTEQSVRLFDYRSPVASQRETQEEPTPCFKERAKSSKTSRNEQGKQGESLKEE